MPRGYPKQTCHVAEAARIPVTDGWRDRQVPRAGWGLGVPGKVRTESGSPKFQLPRRGTAGAAPAIDIRQGIHGREGQLRTASGRGIRREWGSLDRSLTSGLDLVLSPRETNGWGVVPCSCLAGRGHQIRRARSRPLREAFLITLPSLGAPPRGPTNHDQARNDCQRNGSAVARPRVPISPSSTVLLRYRHPRSSH